MEEQVYRKYVIGSDKSIGEVSVTVTNISKDYLEGKREDLIRMKDEIAEQMSLQIADMENEIAAIDKILKRL